MAACVCMAWACAQRRRQQELHQDKRGSDPLQHMLWGPPLLRLTFVRVAEEFCLYPVGERTELKLSNLLQDGAQRSPASVHYQEHLVHLLALAGHAAWSGRADKPVACGHNGPLPLPKPASTPLPWDAVSPELGQQSGQNVIADQFQCELVQAREVSGISPGGLRHREEARVTRKSCAAAASPAAAAQNSRPRMFRGSRLAAPVRHSSAALRPP